MKKIRVLLIEGGKQAYSMYPKEEVGQKNILADIDKYVEKIN